MKKRYDYLVVGAGLYGATFANKMHECGKRVLVIDRRTHIGGNVYTEKMQGINVHKYGAHIFHTSNDEVWNYVNRFARFNRFTNSPIAIYRGHAYSMPFNMHTFSELWGVTAPHEARQRLEKERIDASTSNPANFEEQAISMVGKEIYEKLIKGYTEKQWGRSCKDLPASIIRRIPLRFTYDNNYFDDLHQGIPKGGYTAMVERMLDGTDVILGEDYLCDKGTFDSMAEKVLYTGSIDEFFGYDLGTLEYRSLKFETDTVDEDNYQGNAVCNYTEREIPWTRIIEHKWFEFGINDTGEEIGGSVVTREYPSTWKPGKEPFYPINDERNQALFERYSKLAEREKNVMFGGRLAEYRYYDMDDVIEGALNMARIEIK